MDSTLSAKRWFAVGIGALTLSGLLSLVLVFARAPVISEWITDPLFARRCLVVHVNLAMFVWLLALIASLFHLIPRTAPGASPPVDASGLAVAGIILFVMSGGLPNVPPVLSNYIPVLDSGLFFVGMGLVALALAVTFATGRVGPTTHWPDAPVRPVLPPSARIGLKFAGAAFLITCLTLLITLWRIPPDLPPDHYYETLFWGAGHVLQFVNVAGMISVWCVLAYQLTGQDCLSPRAARIAFALLLLPICYAPIIAYRVSEAGVYHLQFTRLMQFGIFPAVLLFIALMGIPIARFLRRTGTATLWHSPWGLGWITSVALTLVGFILGALIRTSNTLVPAHYHASIGGVTVAYMAVSFRLLQRFEVPMPLPRFNRLSRWQPALFGLGQIIFAVGFGMAGMGRKLYGIEQIIQTPSQFIGLSLMVIGGLLAVVGGVLFVWYVGWSVTKQIPMFVLAKRRTLWQNLRNIPSKN